MWHGSRIQKLPGNWESERCPPAVQMDRILKLTPHDATKSGSEQILVLRQQIGSTGFRITCGPLRNHWQSYLGQMGIRCTHFGTCASHTIARIVLRGCVHVSRIRIWHLVAQEICRRGWRLDRDALVRRSGTTAVKNACDEDNDHNA